jgi:hypothetical protein
MKLLIDLHTDGFIDIVNASFIDFDELLQIQLKVRCCKANQQYRNYSPYSHMFSCSQR